MSASHPRRQQWLVKLCLITHTLQDKTNRARSLSRCASSPSQPAGTDRRVPASVRTEPGNSRTAVVGINARRAALRLPCHMHSPTASTAAQADLAHPSAPVCRPSTPATVPRTDTPSSSFRPNPPALSHPATRGPTPHVSRPHRYPRRCSLLTQPLYTTACPSVRLAHSMLGIGCPVPLTAARGGCKRTGAASTIPEAAAHLGAAVGTAPGSNRLLASPAWCRVHREPKLCLRLHVA